MWSISLSRPFGDLPARRITFFVSVILVALFAVFIAHATPVEAQTATGGVIAWSGDTLSYDGYTLKRYDTPQSGGAFPNLAGTACENNGPIFYSDIYPDAIYKRNSPAYQEDRYWMHVVCLDENSDGSDKSQPIDATLLDYSILKADTSPDDVRGGALDSRFTFSVQVLPEGSDASGTNESSDEATSTCGSEYTYGIGWILCPTMRWLASGMDLLYNTLSKFLVVEPVLASDKSPLYELWGMVRNIANIMFIIGFLIIVYSQVTSIGLSSYGVKRLLPRLVIAAVLVNISYWITALAVDLSNILGTYLYDVLAIVRDKLIKEAPSDLGKITWEGLTGLLLSGSLAGIGAIGLATSVIASAGGSIFFLSVVLVGALVSVLVAVLVMAARQALITVLIIIAPLAFVAYLLPSTEKYFDRWRSIFTTMMIVYPAFALVFGGAQIAGLAIMSTADPGSENYFNLIVLGMAVQVAPVVITPLLIKLSGSLVGRIAGIVDNPNRGIIDRTKKFAQDRSDMHKNTQIGRRNKDGKLTHNNPLAAGARWMALRDVNRQRKLKAYEGTIESVYADTKQSREVHAQNELNEMAKSTGEDRAKSEFAKTIESEDNATNMYILRQIRHDEAEYMENRNKSAYEAARTKPGVANAAIRDLANQAHKVHSLALDETQRQSAITQEHDNQYWRNLASDPVRRARAGAAGIAEYGEERIVNIAQQKQSEERTKRISATISSLEKDEAKLSEEKAVILGDAANAGKFAYLTTDPDSRSGAIRHYVDRAPIKFVQELMTDLDITIKANGDPVAEVLRSELAGALKKRKPFYLSQTILNKISEGTLESKYYGDDGRALMIKETLNAKGLGTETMVSADRDDLQAVRDYLKKYGINSLDASAQKALRDSLNTAFSDARFSSKMDKRAIELEEIRGLL